LAHSILFAFVGIRVVSLRSQEVKAHALEDMSRRGFIKTAVIGAAGEYFLLRSKSVAAEPLNLPIGLELDTVGSDFDSDPHGTLEKLPSARSRSNSRRSAKLHRARLRLSPTAA
jgi:hypothetical protein